MTQPLPQFFGYTYSAFLSESARAVRHETYGPDEDIGQNGWLTASEHRQFMDWLAIGPSSRVLDVASGSGGPALFMAQTTGCAITGLDHSDEGVATARQVAAQLGIEARAQFRAGDGNDPLPFEDDSFDAVLCIDAMNHLPDRPAVLREWHRVTRPGGRILYTDPVIITGPTTNHELAARSSLGTFLFTLAGYNEQVIAAAGFSLLHAEDRTENEERVALRWHDARETHRASLLLSEDEAYFEGIQRFMAIVHKLTSERRLARWVYVARKA